MSEPLFHPPAWLLLQPHPELLQVRDLERGDGFDVQGALCEQLRSDPQAARPLLQVMGELNGTVQRFAGQLGPHGARPLTRAELLRGAGYELLFLELTARCNERCSHCYAGSSPEREETLEPALIEAALRDARALGFRSVQLTGGDPLVSPHCAHAARTVHALGFESLEVYTNGLALRGALYETLRALEASFAFSFYSADPQVHDAMTQTPGSQARTLAAIRKVAADGLQVRASIVLNEHTLPTLEATRRLLRQAGVADTAIAADQERGVGRGTFVPALHGVAAPARSHASPAALARGFWGKAAIAPDGEVFPCIFGRELSLGNLHARSLREVLNDPVPLPVDAGRALAEAEALGSRLSCWECRVRSALCGVRPGPEPELVQLGGREGAA